MESQSDQIFLEKLDELSHLWDGTENWVLHAFAHAETNLKVVFQGERPSVQELLALRKLLEEYREMPIQYMKAQIGTSKVLELGQRRTSEIQPLLEQARELSLCLISTDASYTSYLPFNPTEQIALLIENHELSKRVTKKMLEAGIAITMYMDVD